MRPRVEPGGGCRQDANAPGGTNVAASPDTKEEMIEEFDRELTALGLRGHWRGVVREKLAPGARAQLWKWDSIYNNLVKSGELINLDYTGRRTIQLVSPGLDGTSPTI